MAVVVEAGVEAVAADEDSERTKFGLSYVLSLNRPFQRRPEAMKKVMGRVLVLEVFLAREGSTQPRV